MDAAFSDLCEFLLELLMSLGEDIPDCLLLGCDLVAADNAGGDRLDRPTAR